MASAAAEAAAAVAGLNSTGGGRFGAGVGEAAAVVRRVARGRGVACVAVWERGETSPNRCTTGQGGGGGSRERFSVKNVDASPVFRVRVYYMQRVCYNIRVRHRKQIVCPNCTTYNIIISL